MVLLFDFDLADLPRRADVTARRLPHKDDRWASAAPTGKPLRPRFARDRSACPRPPVRGSGYVAAKSCADADIGWGQRRNCA